MKTLQEKIAVMQAAADGKVIEACYHDNDWLPSPSPCWDWMTYDYRVKPTPIKVYFIAYKGAPDLSSANFCKPTCDSRDIAAGYSVVEFIEVLK